ncbi:MAG: amidophosphoribosyltransferase [Oscillospiraceae bacterium]|nr:amidophosphoribosyltransferase [Oscillospiraceae bacterium]
MYGNIHEECGVFGIYSKASGGDVAAQAYLALFALQHRGQESCGIAVCDDGVIGYHRDLGLVPEVFTPETLEKLGRGNMAIGHVRYAPSGQTKKRSNAQPLVVRHIKGTMAIAHNGNLTNAARLREGLELNGAIFHANNDAEVISYMITKARLNTGSIESAVKEAVNGIEGAYSLIVMSPKKLVAARDPHGFRPLCIGKRGGDYLVASESCALDCLGADFLRDIQPGEVIVIDENGLRTVRQGTGKPTGLCVFEFVYFARQDSVIEGVCVHEARRRAGAFLATERPVAADVVIGVPESGIDAAMGYSRASGIPHGMGFTKNRYVGRTFIQPTQRERERAVGIKLNAIASTVRGKRVVMIDDSIVRGTTTGKIVGLVRGAGAKEVHLRISAPPFRHPCYFGTDVDSADNLIAGKMSEDEICAHIGADSLGYLSSESVVKIAQESGCGFCTGCFTGEYPLPKPEKPNTDKFERKIGR